MIVANKDEKILLLNNGQIIQTNLKKEVTTFNFEETQFDLSKYSSKTTKTPKIQELSTAKLFLCTKNLLNNLEINLKIKNLNCKKDIFKDLIQQLFQRMYLPFYIILMALTSSLLVLKSKNTLHYSSFKTMVFLIGVLFLVIPKILLNYTGSNYLNNLFFLLFPIFSYILIYQYISFKIKFN
jgi:lipopolysaccharide export system permease protein